MQQSEDTATIDLPFTNPPTAKAEALIQLVTQGRSGRSSRHGAGATVERPVSRMKLPVRPAVLRGEFWRCLY